MAKFNIISKDGSKVRFTGEPKYTGTYLGVPYVEFSSISSPTPIDWQRGDYVEYYRTGMTYRLYSTPEPKKQAEKGAYGAAFVYSNVKFYSAAKDLEIAPFRDIVPEDNDIHFSTRPDVSTFENVYGIASRIQECMNDIFPNKWEIRVYDTSDADLKALFEEAKDFSVSNGSCLDALSQIYESWKNVGWTHTTEGDKEVITIGRTSLRDSANTTDAYGYGIGKGLTSIKKAAANEGEFATRLYVYGSDRNIQTKYYNQQNIHNKDSVNIVNLMIPPSKWGKTNGKPDARKAYLEASEDIINKYGLIPRTVYFDGSQNEEIYPSITGLTCSQVRKAILDAGGDVNDPYLPADKSDKIDTVYSATGYGDGSKAEVENSGDFVLNVPVIGFDIFTQGKLTSNGEAVISMKSGACIGREFKVKGSMLSGQMVPGVRTYSITLERNWDESLGLGFPNDVYPIKEGDTYVLLDIPMPDYYITLAQDRLYEEAQKLLEDYTRVSAYYEPSLDSIKIKSGGKLIREGMYMQVYDEDVVDTDNHYDYVLIDTLNIDEKGELPRYQVTLREQKRSARTFGTLEGMIEDAKRDTSEKIDRQRQYTERRFRSAQETIEMLKGAFSNFSEGITPVTVQTMSLLIGDESLQYKFTESRNSLVDVPCPLSYNNSTKQFTAISASIVHMTLGIDTVTTAKSRTASEYKSWNMPTWNSTQFEIAEKRYYIYAKVPISGSTGSYVFSETAIDMTSVSGYYHLLIGVLNSEYDNARDFVTLYGYTEVLPGQIATDVIRDGGNNLVIDLVNATITAKNGAKIIGDITFGSNTTGLENIPEWKELDNAVSDLQNQVDGVTESYFLEGAPTLSNEPYISWTTDQEKLDHIGDTYTNINDYEDENGNIIDPDGGKSWRWCICTNPNAYDYVEVTDKNGVKQKLHWHPIANTDATKALLEAAEAKAAAERAAEEAKRANDELTEWAKDGIISPVEKRGLEDEITRVTADWEDIMNAVSRYGISGQDFLEYERNYDEYIAEMERILETSGSVAVGDLDDCRESYYNSRIYIYEVIEAAAKKVATDAAALANTALGKFSDWSSDLKFSPSEIKELANERLSVNEDYNTLRSQIISLGLTEENDTFDDYSIARTGYLMAITDVEDAYEALSDKTQSVNIPTYFKSRMETYYTARTNVMNLIGAANADNLLANSAEMILSAVDKNTYKVFALPINVSTGDEFTFKAENARLMDGTATKYSVRILNPTLTTSYSDNQMSFGANKSQTIKITATGVSNAEAVCLIYAGVLNSTTGNTISLTKFSLVKGTYTKPKWEDYRGDNGLQNLLPNSDKLTYAATANYSGYVYNFPNLSVKYGDTFTFCAEHATNKVGSFSQYAIYMYCYDANNNEVNLSGVQLVNLGHYRKLTLTSSRDSIGTVYFKIYAGPSSATSGKTIELTNFSLVRGSTPLIAWRDNMDYVTNAFKNGSTQISGGLVMTQAVMVEDGNGIVEGMLNGSDYGKDTTHGKLILAAGSDGASEAKMRSALTKIYEDGTIDTKKIKAQGGEIGKFTISNGGYLSINTTTVSGSMQLGEDGLTVGDVAAGVYATVGGCAGTSATIANGGAVFCPAKNDSRKIALMVASSNTAIYCGSGMFAGLRPKVRAVQSDTTLEDDDHTIVNINSSASKAVYLTLPSGPKAGQTYRICNKYNTYLYVGCNSKSIRDLWTGGVIDILTVSKANMIDVIWDGSEWLVSKAHE